MRRNSLISILAAALVLVGSGFSYPIPFDVTQTYNSGVGTTITDGNSNPGYYSPPLSLTVSFDPWVDSFVSASLDLTYSGISTRTSGQTELWFALGSDTSGNPSTFTQLGQLVPHDNVTWTQEFDLSGLEPTVPADGLSSWTLYISFRENTVGNDSFTLYSSRLQGAYNAVQTDPPPPQQPEVPEPATMSLVGAGLVGLAGFMRRCKK